MSEFDIYLRRIYCTEDDRKNFLPAAQLLIAQIRMYAEGAKHDTNVVGDYGARVIAEIRKIVSENETAQDHPSTP